MSAASSIPLISIIVPSYNQGKYIEKTILSILNQSFTNWELIIQDACSKDETAEVCEKYVNTDPRIRFYQEKDNGFADAVNKALSKANGRIAAIQSSDDYYAHAEVFCEVADHFSKNEQLLIVTADFKMIDSDDQIIDSPVRKNKDGFISPISVFTLKNHFPQSSTFFKTERARQIGGLHPEVDMVADTDFWIRMSNYSPIGSKSIFKVNGVWSYAIMHPDQRSADTSKFFLARLVMYSEMLNESRLEVPYEQRLQTFHISMVDAFHYLLFKKRDVKDIIQLHKKVYHKDIPISWSLKSLLFKLPLFHQLYFSNFKDHDSGVKLDLPRAGTALWFRKKS